MVLHLLGKKSWNVYNTANVERVRKDEAEAQAREEAEEQRMQEEDAQRRIALLRGEEVGPVQQRAELTDDVSHQKRRNKHDEDQRDRKRRRRGEDDTDRDIRHARQDTEAGQKATRSLLREREKEAPLQDHAGHIQLIPAPDEVTIRKAEKNAEVEAEKAKKRKREEDQYMMKFSNAAGYQNGMQKPWYAAVKDAAPPKDLALAEAQGKDVWGNEDPRRKERERGRISSSDPFAAMQQAQRQLKQSAHDREVWQKERQAEIEVMKRDDARKEEGRRRADSLDDGFALDAPPERERSRHHHGRERKHRHHHRRRHRSRSRSREHGRHRRRDETK
ncbi:uncharacterized protein RCC_00612 [Ramularia collo-cygni]|uniref:CBF1-interacting co-repressor CIR N-terminal domain-containing protein n=1 Tax=Ramularia collo-cygni TaxID=112498 RepID=A0A2D3UQT8_9PEZI|nr:uncharacterized protein RCC_00612 [Ramularia collo-cygni]CZT14640.1 uncharacterized protein RCC_00612 [Ramularia collo-cygni]